ncbi:hypothetical protein F5X98DRAFT_332355 [Xylaria grammica]|nr:hypothetical protein F5X98DRAFT_332355 [Xylaria grammica]
MRARTFLGAQLACVTALLHTIGGIGHSQPSSVKKPLVPNQSINLFGRGGERGHTTTNGIRNEGLLMARAATWSEIAQQASPLLPTAEMQKWLTPPREKYLAGTWGAFRDTRLIGLPTDRSRFVSFLSLVC